MTLNEAIKALTDGAKWSGARDRLMMVDNEDVLWIGVGPDGCCVYVSDLCRATAGPCWSRTRGPPCATATSTLKA